MVAFLLHSAFNIADAIFVGWISADALAAVSISFPIVFFLIALGSGIGVGGTSVLARYIGSGNRDSANRTAEHALLSAAVLGVVLAVAGIGLAPYLFPIMGATDNLTDLSLSYINIILLFSPFMLCAMVGNSLLRGDGDMKTPMYVMGSAAILNIILDPIFIFGLDLGVVGAAIATVIARMSAIVYLIYHILSGKSRISLDFQRFKLDMGYVIDIFSVGIPSSISNVIMSFGMFLLNVIVGMFGVEALAAFGIGFRLDSIALLPGMGIMMSILSIVGQSLGAGKRERAREATIKGGIMACAFMTLVGVIFFAFAPQIVSIFNDDPLVTEYAISFIRTIPATYLVVGMAMCITGAFLGAGKAHYALAITFMRMIVFSVPLAYLLSLTYGVFGIWAGIVIGTYMTFFVSIIMYRFTPWDHIQPNQ